MSEIIADNLYHPLSKITRVSSLLSSPMVPNVVVDVRAEKMRVANSVQYWQTNAPGVPDMQLVADKAKYLASLLAGYGDPVMYTNLPTENLFLLGGIGISLVKPVTKFYDGIEEVLLKPVLVNDYTLSAGTVEFNAAVKTVEDGTHPRVISLLLTQDGVIVRGKDTHGNNVSVGVAGKFIGPQMEVFFPTKELQALASMLKDEKTTLRFGAGTKTRPAPLLATDSLSGLTVVLSPTHP